MAMRPPVSVPTLSRRAKIVIGAIVVLLVLFTAIGTLTNVYVDYLWFDEVDKTSVYSGVLLTRLMLFLVIGAVMALIVGGNLYLAYRLRPLLRPHSAEQATLERYRMRASFRAVNRARWERSASTRFERTAAPRPVLSVRLCMVTRSAALPISPPSASSSKTR